MGSHCLAKQQRTNACFNSFLPEHSRRDQPAETFHAIRPIKTSEPNTPVTIWNDVFLLRVTMQLPLQKQQLFEQFVQGVLGRPFFGSRPQLRTIRERLR
jgi:hypothetical protein